MEKLDRALVAVHQGYDSVYIGWRLLASDSTDISLIRTVRMEMMMLHFDMLWLNDTAGLVIQCRNKKKY